MDAQPLVSGSDKWTEAWESVTTDAKRFVRWYAKAGVTMHARRGPSLETAEDVLIERAGIVAALFQHGLGYLSDDVIRWLGEPMHKGITTQHTSLTAGASLLEAMPYLWIEEMRQAAVAGADDLPRHTIGKGTLPHPIMWWTYPNDMSMTAHGPGSLEVFGLGSKPGLIGSIIHPGMTKDMQFCIQQTDIMVHSDSDSAEAASAYYLLTEQLIPFGATFPDDCVNEGQRHKVATLLAMLAFVRSPHLLHFRADARRPYRRMMQRTQAPKGMVQSVGFTILRHPKAVGYEGPDESQEVNWQHRWLVGGHYRNQWYPSAESHQVIWIAPYLKGPEGAPMKERVYKVAR